MDIATLLYYANHLNIIIPFHIEKKTSEFLSNELEQNFEKMPIREIFWGFSYLFTRDYSPEQLKDPLQYIFTFQNENGGIGFYKGDVSRIPSTGWFLSLILSKKFYSGNIYKIHQKNILGAVDFLIEEWEKDVSMDHALAYKGAYVLTSLLKCVELHINHLKIENTIKNTVKILLDMQIENGSWTFLLKQSNKKISIALSTPHITSQVMLSLLQVYIMNKSIPFDISHNQVFGRIPAAIERGVKYLCETQSEMGFWYAHSAGELAIINGQCALALKRALEVLP